MNRIILSLVVFLLPIEVQAQLPYIDWWQFSDDDKLPDQSTWAAYYRQHARIRLEPEHRLPNGMAWRLHTDTVTGLAFPRITWMANARSQRAANRLLETGHVGRGVDWRNQRFEGGIRLEGAFDTPGTHASNRRGAHLCKLPAAKRRRSRRHRHPRIVLGQDHPRPDFRSCYGENPSPRRLPRQQCALRSGGWLWRWEFSVSVRRASARLRPEIIRKLRRAAAGAWRAGRKGSSAQHRPASHLLHQPIHRGAQPHQRECAARPLPDLRWVGRHEHDVLAQRCQRKLRFHEIGDQSRHHPPCRTQALMIEGPWRDELLSLH